MGALIGPYRANIIGEDDYPMRTTIDYPVKVLGMPECSESSFKCLITSEVTRTQEPHQQMRNEISACLLSFSADPMTRKIEIFEKSGLDPVKW